MALDGKREEAIGKMNAECRPLLAALLKTTSELIEYEYAQAGGIAKAADAG